MNFIEFESAQKLRGGYYTERDIAVFLTRWALESQPKRILEPSCGDGVFFHAIADLPHRSVDSVVGYELDTGEAQKARARGGLITGVSSRVYAQDFLHWFLNRPSAEPEFEAVLGNPPFVRYQYLETAQQSLAEQIFARHHLRFTRHTNAWVPFVVAALALLRPAGRLAMVVPAELLHVLHAEPLRDFILTQCSRVLVVDPEDIWFRHTLQGVILLMAEKRGEGDHGVTSLAIHRVANRQHLTIPAAEHFARADFFPGSVLNGKWMVGLLGSRERALMVELGQSHLIRRFADVASVDVGIVTGANQFFLVPDSVVEQYGLQNWAYPAFGRSQHVRGVIYDERNHEQNRRLGLPTNFLWFEDTLYNQLDNSARRYIGEGEAQDLHKRYKCRIRSPWYAVPSVYHAPVGMLKRSHHYPRLVLNTIKALTTDTAYRITVKKGEAADLVVSFVNSLTALSSELEGRHYGGGVLELVPSEIEKLLVPIGKHPATALRELDSAVRNGVPAEELLARQDEMLLKPIGVAKADRDALLAAWVRLRGRRQRTTREKPLPTSSSNKLAPNGFWGFWG